MNSPLVLDSVTRFGADARGRVVVGGSHGGSYAAWLCARAGVAAVLLNDAGVGLEAAGIGGLELLQAQGIPAATVSHRSARIGDGADALARGVVSHANAAALALGVGLGMSCELAVRRLAAATPLAGTPPEAIEARRAIPLPGARRARAFAMDSISLVEPGDAGAVVLAGSHGGLLGGRPETAVRQPVFAALFNDADRGIDDAGVTRLPALEARGIAAGCVSAWTARIGDGASLQATGVVSALNAPALRLGARLGMTAAAFVATMADAIEGAGA